MDTVVIGRETEHVSCLAVVETETVVRSIKLAVLSYRNICIVYDLTYEGLTIPFKVYLICIDSPLPITLGNSPLILIVFATVSLVIVTEDIVHPLWQ